MEMIEEIKSEAKPKSKYVLFTGWENLPKAKLSKKGNIISPAEPHYELKTSSTGIVKLIAVFWQPNGAYRKLIRRFNPNKDADKIALAEIRKELR